MITQVGTFFRYRFYNIRIYAHYLVLLNADTQLFFEQIPTCMRAFMAKYSTISKYKCTIFLHLHVLILFSLKKTQIATKTVQQVSVLCDFMLD